MTVPGKVFLVGGGPGDPGLLTVRGQELLRQVDVVLYDYLVEPGLVELAPGAELLYAGKSHEDGGRVPQEETTQLLIDRARAGKMVVRLKGGDPFLFGRGGEEAQALAAAGIPFEMVPGVSSAWAVPAYAGIPLTHRDVASSVTILTGHEQPAKMASSIPWGQVATGSGTLVFLMAMTNLEAIVEQLVLHGRPSGTPAAAIRWGTRPEQHTVVGTLADIASRVRAAGLRSPAVVVVGEVVKLRDELNWFERLPLFGVSVLVTRAREQASVFSEVLRRDGALVYEAPVIAIEPPDDMAQCDRTIEALARYDWIIFTSGNGVDRFCRRVWAQGGDARAFSAARICAIGPQTAKALEQYGLRPDLMPPSYVAESIGEALSRETVRRVLIPRAKVARDVLPALLRERGAEVDVVEVYQTKPPSESGERIGSLLAEGKVDVVTFTSSSTVTNFLALAGALPPEVAVACIGPVTAATAQERGLRVDVMAESYTTEGLHSALVQYAAKHGLGFPKS